MTAIEQKTELETKIAELETWAECLEYGAADSSSPYWVRQQDFERAWNIRMKIEMLRGLEQAAFAKCATHGCSTFVAGSRYCARCEDEIHGEPYPLRDVLRETFVDWVLRRLSAISALVHSA